MSFLLDTCVLSELVKPRPDVGVVSWVEGQDEHLLHLSVITLGELQKGIAKLAAGDRRDRLQGWVDRELVTRFAGRILTVDEDVAALWGVMLGEAEARGEPLPAIDTLIAATAAVSGCAVVTRNVSHIARAGVDTVNPWS